MTSCWFFVRGLLGQQAPYRRHDEAMSQVPDCFSPPLPYSKGPLVVAARGSADPFYSPLTSAMSAAARRLRHGRSTTGRFSPSPPPLFFFPGTQLEDGRFEACAARGQLRCSSPPPLFRAYGQIGRRVQNGARVFGPATFSSANSGGPRQRRETPIASLAFFP